MNSSKALHTLERADAHLSDDIWNELSEEDSLSTERLKAFVAARILIYPRIVALRNAPTKIYWPAFFIWIVYPIAVTIGLIALWWRC